MVFSWKFIFHLSQFSFSGHQNLYIFSLTLITDNQGILFTSFKSPCNKHLNDLKHYKQISFVKDKERNGS